MSSLKQKNRRAAVLIILMCVVIGLFAVYRVMTGQHKTPLFATTQATTINGSILKEPQFLPDFSLTQGNGKPFTRRYLDSKWTLLFFGFSNCPYVCPTTLAELNKTVAAVSTKLPKSLVPQVVMVSVDPERDTTARMKSYVSSFNPHFIGVRAPKKETAAFASAMHVSYAKITAGESKHYTMTHTASIMVIGPGGRLRAYLSYPHTAEQMTKDYMTLMHVFQQAN